MDSKGPVKCRKDCGFYGSADRDGMCSKCYKDSVPSHRLGAEGASPDTTNNPPPNMPRLGNKRTSRRRDVGGASAESSSTQQQSTPLSSGNERAVHMRALASQITAADTPDSAEVDKLAANLLAMMSPRVTDVASTSVDSTPVSSTSGADALPSGPRLPADGCDSPVTKEVIAKAVADFNRCIGLTSSDDLSADGAVDSGAPTATRKRLRCHQCRKKVGLTGFSCRCEGLFCSMHRYSDQHNCTFDYKSHGQEDIRKNNPVVAAEKVREI